MRKIGGNPETKLIYVERKGNMRCFSKLTSTLFIVFLLLNTLFPFCGTAATASSDAGDVFLKCDFEPGFQESVSVVAKGNVAEIVAFSNSTAVHMKKTSTDDEFADIYLSNYHSNSVVYSVAVYAVSKNIHAEFYFVDSEGNTIEAWNMSPPDGFLSFLNTKFKVNGGDGEKEYAPATWHTLSVVIDKANKTKNVYVNGTAIASNIAINQSFDWDKVRFFRMHIKGEQTGDEMYLDNVHIYGGTAPRDVTNEACALSSLENGGSVFEGTEKLQNFMSDKIAYHERSGLLYKNGAKTKYEPVFAEDTLLLPCELFERAFDLACTVSESGASLGSLSVNATGITNGGVAVTLPTNPVYSKNTWYVPFEAVCGALGKHVLYDNEVVSGGCFLVSDNEINVSEATDADKKTLNDFLMYQRPTMSDVRSDIQSSSLKNVHPRILATADDFESLRSLCETDTRMMGWKEKLIATANGYLGADPLEWVLSDGVRLHNANELHRQLMVLSLAYRLTGEEKYAEQAFVQMKAGAQWQDWHPEHTLDTSAAAIGMAIGYDWLYDWLSTDSEKLALVEEGMYTNGISPYVSGYRNRNDEMVRGITADNNWGPVVNAGGAVLALALSDRYPEEAAYIVSNSVRAIEPALVHFAPKGSWYEGIGYASMTQEYLAYHFAVMNEILGTVYSVDAAEGLSTTARAILYLQSPLGAFAYLDSASQSVQCDSALLYFAEYYNDSEVVGTWFQTFDIDWQTDDLVRTMLWYKPESASKTAELETDVYNPGEEVITARDTWEKTSDTFVGMKGGSPNIPHGHMDIGDFAFYANGTRWTGFVGNESYNLDGYWEYGDDSLRWTYYGLRAEAKNCLVIDPDESGGFLSNSKAEFTRYESKPKGMIAVLDMTSSYGSEKVTKAERGYYFTDERQSLVVRDEVSLTKTSDLCWFMQTEHNCEVIGNSVIISSKSTPHRRVVLSFECSDDFEISVGQSEPLETSPKPDGLKDTSWMNRIMLKMNTSGQASITAKLTPYGLDLSEVSDYDKSFAQWSIAEGELIASEESAYGDIAEEYADADTYPFAVFDSEGRFVKGYSAWATNGSDGALPKCPDGGTILLRRNFNAGWADTNMQYPNLCYDKGTRTLDLGGYTFDVTYHNTQPMFNYFAKGAGEPLNINVKNGCIVYGRNGVVGFSQNSGGKSNAVHFTFDDIIFRYTTNNIGSSPSQKLISYGSKAVDNQYTTASVRFQDCIFDISSLNKEIPLFEAGEKDGAVRCRVEITGSRIIASSSVKNTWTQVNNDSSTILLKADDDGLYLRLTVPNGTELSNRTVISGSETYTFDSFEVGDVNTVYSLKEDTVVRLKPDRAVVKNVKENIWFILASYAGDELLDIKILPTGEDSQMLFSQMNTTGADLLKAFAWNGESLRPLCAEQAMSLAAE